MREWKKWLLERLDLPTMANGRHNRIIEVGQKNQQGTPPDLSGNIGEEFGKIRCDAASLHGVKRIAADIIMRLAAFGPDKFPEAR